MKRIFSGFCAVVTCAALAFCLITVSAASGGASVYQIAADANGEPWSMAILVKYAGAVYAYTSYTNTRNGETNYLYDLNNETAYEMVWVESVGEISSWQVSNYDGSSLFAAAAPRKNDAVNVYYLNGDSQLYKAQRTIADVAQVFDDGTATVVLDSAVSSLDSELSPGFLLDEDYNCLGIMSSDQRAYVAWFDQATFGSTSTPSSPSSPSTPSSPSSPGSQTGGDSSNFPWPTAALAVGAVAAAGLFLKKRPGQQGEVNDVPQNRDMGQFEPYGETEPLPGPPVIPEPPQPVAAGPLFLSCSGGYMDGRLYPIDADTILIGRDTSCTIKYPSDYAGVSRQHAILRRQDGALTLMDISSTGTYLKRISGKLTPKQPVPVDVGDVFYVGERKNRFEITRK